jgi:hypothetical protein
MSIHELAARIEALETINRLEPDAAERPSTKFLRSRAKRLTKKITAFNAAAEGIQLSDMVVES